MNRLFPQVRQIAADILELAPDDLTASSSPGTVAGWDSLQHLNLIVALEQAFHVEFTPEEMERMTSLETVAEVLVAKNGSSAPRQG